MKHEDIITVACANVHQLAAGREGDLDRLTQFIGLAARAGSNLIVFPETAFTAAGSLTDESETLDTPRHELAETIPGPLTEVLEKEARKHDIYVVAGMLEKDVSDPEVIYNAACVIDPEKGLAGVYRKTHLFKTEKAYLTPGDALPIFETRYGPIGVLICADFYCYPETVRTLALDGARLILLVTSVMVTLKDLEGKIVIYEGALEFVPDIIKVRSYENHIHIAAANTVGPSLMGYRGFGKSMIVGPHPPGSFFVKTFAGPASQVQDELITATLNLKDMDAVRRRLWENRRADLYGALIRGAKT
ncbi:MAG: carbon-nitrogen hydrolase family protein [Deltaproteobacteria bacterium]|nr:carbon-nitrogen hydrolase family protein [Deltaproteobacteria bacterium]